MLYRLPIDPAEPTLAPWLTNHTFSLRIFSPHIPWQETINPDHGTGLRDVKVRQVLRLLEDGDWLLVRTRGSHRQFKHPSKAGRVTVAGKPGDDLAPGTLNSIVKQAGLKR